MEYPIKYLKFYAHCIPVSGSNKGCVYDLQRGDLYNFPNSFIELLLSYRDKPLSLMMSENKFQEAVLKKYLSFLEESELIFYTEKPEKFPNLELDYLRPFHIDNLFIEINDIKENKWDFLKTKVESTGVLNVVFIYNDINYSQDGIKIIEEIIEIYRYSRIQYISFVLNYGTEIVKKAKEIHKREPKVYETIFFNAKYNRKTKNGVYYYKGNQSAVFNRRIKAVDDFFVNKDIYLLGKQFNPYYFRSAYINNEGFLKNSMFNGQDYGNVFKEDILELIKNEEFTKLWYINKDQIEICADCQYRYICNDNRIPISVENSKYEHETECAYNPYNNEWKS